MNDSIKVLQQQGFYGKVDLNIQIEIYPITQHQSYRELTAPEMEWHKNEEKIKHLNLRGADERLFMPLNLIFHDRFSSTHLNDARYVQSVQVKALETIEKSLSASNAESELRRMGKVTLLREVSSHPQLSKNYTGDNSCNFY